MPQYRITIPLPWYEAFEQECDARPDAEGAMLGNALDTLRQLLDNAPISSVTSPPVLRDPADIDLSINLADGSALNLSIFFDPARRHVHIRRISPA